MANRGRARLASLLALLVLSGCGGEAGLVIAGATVYSFATTDKFLADHAVSYATGEECSALQMEQTGDYCRTHEEIAMEAAEAEQRRQAAQSDMFCYRTLGEITCYQEPDHQASLAQRVQ
jgi:hypothetical protein